MDWRDAKASFLTDKGANAIARYLGLNKPPEQIREMFGMPAHPYLTIGEVTPEKNNDDLLALSAALSVKSYPKQKLIPCYTLSAQKDKDLYQRQLLL